MPVTVLGGERDTRTSVGNTRTPNTNVSGDKMQNCADKVCRALIDNDFTIRSPFNSLSIGGLSDVLYPVGPWAQLGHAYNDYNLFPTLKENVVVEWG